MITSKGGASEPSDTLLPGKAGGTVAVRRTLASTICWIADPTQVPRPRQLRDVSAVMRSQPAHQSMINRRFDDRASCPAPKSLKQALASKPRIHSPASGNGGHESGQNLTLGAGGWAADDPSQTGRLQQLDSDPASVRNWAFRATRVNRGGWESIHRSGVPVPAAPNRSAAANSHSPP